MFKLKLNNKKIPKYQCPLTKITMNKACPINSCHAWQHGKHPSNCLLQFYPNKTEFDRYDLMYVWECNDKKLREKQITGKNQVYNAASLFNILSRLKENNTDSHCVQCGVVQTNNKCLCNKECEDRASLADKILKTSFLRFPEYKANKTDVFLLLHNKEKIKQFITATDQAKEWFEIIGIKPFLQEKANLVRTTI